MSLHLACSFRTDGKHSSTLSLPLAEVGCPPRAFPLLSVKTPANDGPAGGALAAALAARDDTFWPLAARRCTKAAAAEAAVSLALGHGRWGGSSSAEAKQPSSAGANASSKAAKVVWLSTRRTSSKTNTRTREV
jgi:hypothetical protein